MWLRHSAILFVLLLISCGKELPTLDGFDTDKWKKDKNACLDDEAKAAIAELER